MGEIFERVWQNLIGRLDGPLHFRLIVQPTVAAVLAVRAGLRDAREGRPVFFFGILSQPTHRRELLRQGWKDTRNVLIVAAILDSIYQLIVHRGVYVGELVITATALAIVPYVIVRGPVNRIARMARQHRSSKARSIRPTLSRS